MKKSAFAFILMICCLATTNIFAQKDETLFNKTGIRISGGWGGGSYNITRIGDENILFRGGYGGVELNKSIFLGWGGYESRDNINLENIEAASLNMNYNGFIAGYSPNAYKAFHPQFMVMVGGGEINGDGLTGGKDKITVIQPSAGFEINVFRWFRVGVNGGYRVVTNTDTNVNRISDSDLSAPFGEIKLKFGWSWGR